MVVRVSILSHEWNDCVAFYMLLEKGFCAYVCFFPPFQVKPSWARADLNSRLVSLILALLYHPKESREQKSNAGNTIAQLHHRLPVLIFKLIVKRVKLSFLKTWS